MTLLEHQIVNLIPVEISKGVWLGGANAYENGIEGWREGKEVDEENPNPFEGWKIIHACAEYYDRCDRIEGNGDWKQSSDLNHFWLNLEDGQDMSAINNFAFRRGVYEVLDAIVMNKMCYLHCSMGVSRSPSIALVALAMAGDLPSDYDEAVKAFKELYPIYFPNRGIEEYVKRSWRFYMERVKIAVPKKLKKKVHTVESLRELGFMPEVQHFRRHVDPDGNLDPSLARVSTVKLSGHRVDSNGGLTRVLIRDEADKIVARAEALCSNEEIYNKKIGRAIVIRRAVKKMRSKGLDV